MIRINGKYIRQHQDTDKVIAREKLNVIGREDFGDEDVEKWVTFIDAGIFTVQREYADQFQEIDRLSEVRYGYNNPCLMIGKETKQTKEMLPDGAIRYIVTAAAT